LTVNFFKINLGDIAWGERSGTIFFLSQSNLALKFLKIDSGKYLTVMELGRISQECRHLFEE
jgi:hypothetical protein